MKTYLKNMVISAVKPKVNKTKLGKATSELKIAIQKNKGSKAKLDQTIFEMSYNPKFKGVKNLHLLLNGKAIKESGIEKNKL